MQYNNIAQNYGNLNLSKNQHLGQETNVCTKYKIVSSEYTI